MNTIVVTCVLVHLVIAGFMALPILAVRRWGMEVMKTTAERTTLNALTFAFVAVLGFLFSSVVFNLAEGYAAMYVWEVGWWTL
jgi:hypothetical protein